MVASQTIDEMIAALGAPQSFAEQALMQRMRRCATRAAAERATMASTSLLSPAHTYASGEAHTQWAMVLAFSGAIEVFRQHGRAPVIPGVYDAPAEETADEL